MTAGNAIARHIAERTPLSADSIDVDAKGYRKELPLPAVPQKLECVFFERTSEPCSADWKSMGRYLGVGGPRSGSVHKGGQESLSVDVKGIHKLQKL
jgi:hypothetical protein